MSWEKSSVMSEFLKIAEKEGLLDRYKETAKNPCAEDIKIIEEKRLKDPEKSMIEIAHPEPVYIAEARGDGGLVENEIENQKKMIEIVNKMPTGSLSGRYATAIVELVKLANTCDDLGATAAADLLTIAAKKLVLDLDELPFE